MYFSQIDRETYLVSSVVPCCPEQKFRRDGDMREKIDDGKSWNQSVETPSCSAYTGMTIGQTSRLSYSVHPDRCYRPKRRDIRNMDLLHTTTTVEPRNRPPCPKRGYLPDNFKSLSGDPLSQTEPCRLVPRRTLSCSSIENPGPVIKSLLLLLLLLPGLLRSKTEHVRDAPPAGIPSPNSRNPRPS